MTCALGLGALGDHVDDHVHEWNDGHQEEEPDLAVALANEEEEGDEVGREDQALVDGGRKADRVGGDAEHHR